MKESALMKNKKNLFLSLFATALVAVSTSCVVNQATPDGDATKRSNNLRSRHNESRKETPLVEAARKGNVALVKKLIAAGANVNEKNEWGETALVLAAQDGKSEYVSGMTGENIRFGADERTEAQKEKEWKEKMAKAEEARKRYVEVVKALLAAGADVNAWSIDGLVLTRMMTDVDARGVKALMMAAGRGNTEV